MANRVSRGDSRAAGSSSAPRQWRKHCDEHPTRFRALSTIAAERRRLERAEEQLIARMMETTASLMERAVAFRGLIELRSCTARDAGTFFSVNPAVIVAGLSLLEVTQSRPLGVVPSAAPGVLHSMARAG